MPTEIPWADTLTAHHSYASHLPQKLDQACSEYLDCTPWKIKHGRRGNNAKHEKPQDMSAEELTRYNAADCRVTIKAWNSLQKDLDRERHVYEHDLCLADLCVEMTKNGFRVDLKLQAELSTRLKNKAYVLRTEMRKIVGDRKFRPSSDEEVRRALFDTLQVRKLHMTETGLPSVDKTVIQALRSEDTPAGRLAGLLSQRREVLKSKTTFIDYPLKIIFPYKGEKDRAHFSWGARERRDQRTVGGGHTVSGRLGCRIHNTPKYNPENTPDRAREMFIASEGNLLCYFDVKQGEPRVGSYLSGDPARIEDCKGDVHGNFAKVLFPIAGDRGWLENDPTCQKCTTGIGKCSCPKADPTRGKPFRDLAKNMGLARDYFAEEDQVFSYLMANRFDFKGRALYGAVSLIEIRNALARARMRYHVYVAWGTKIHAQVKRTGFLRSPVLGRIRWLGWHPPITEPANFLIQSCLADVMNLRVLAHHGSPRFKRWALKNSAILEKVSIPRDSAQWPRMGKKTRLVLQHHDSCTYDTPKGEVSRLQDGQARLWEGKIYLDGGELILPIDVKKGERWSDF